MKLFLKNVSLFFAAPFIALVYVVALPFVGMYMFINLAIEASAKKISLSEAISANVEEA
jgi:hypothetical protein